MTFCAAILLRPVDAATAERAWPLALPFHYGSVTVGRFAELHLRLRVEFAGGGVALGHAAEVAAPKWFEKQPEIRVAESVDRLRLVARRAAIAACDLMAGPICIAECSDVLVHRLAADSAIVAGGLTPLEVSFGVALVERALIDAACRHLGVSFESAVAVDVFGAGQFAGVEYPRWLALRGPAPTTMQIRHTVGLDDPLPAQDMDGKRPVSLVDTIAVHGVRAFKVKFNASDAAIDRLEAIAAVLERHLPDYGVTIDANEAFLTADAFASTIDQIARRPALERFMGAVRYIEQPLHRSVADTSDLRKLGLSIPIIIDESDYGEDAYQRARDLGYAGVSIKTCKGVLRGLRNAARASAWGGFVSAEDLCVQPGINLQHNLATAAAVRVQECERNGHHFGPGPANLPAAERHALVAQHGDLYSTSGLIIAAGSLSLSTTLDAPGFGTVVRPDLSYT